MQAAAQTLDPRASRTLSRIDGTERQLLALRSYLRAGDSLGKRWSWTEAEIVRYERSAEHRALQADIARVERQFERGNPGYALQFDSHVRSLDMQIERWNHDDSVRRAAEELTTIMERYVADDAPLHALSATSTRHFIELLRHQTLKNVATLAAPGLSRHGQMRAIDFAVRRGTAIVAGADVRLVPRQWYLEGWSERLRTAVVDSGAPFFGPLSDPPEPWHYDYEPERKMAAR